MRNRFAIPRRGDGARDGTIENGEWNKTSSAKGEGDARTLRERESRRENGEKLAARAKEEIDGRWEKCAPKFI